MAGDRRRNPTAGLGLAALSQFVIQREPTAPVHAPGHAPADAAARGAVARGSEPVGDSDPGATDNRSADEQALYRAMAGVVRLPHHGRAWVERPAPRPIATQRQLDEQEALWATMSDAFDPAHWLEADENLSFRRPGIGEDVLTKLRRGHWAVSAALDLHGLRSDAARDSVARFIDSSTRNGRRCVRIIHGKGLGSIDRQPVLKNKVWRWLVQRAEVLAFCEASPFAGGSGALMVLLRPPPTRR